MNMNTIPNITQEQADAMGLNKTVCNALINGANIINRNKAIEIALAEQSAEQYITAEQARELGAGNAEYQTGSGEWDACKPYGSVCFPYLERFFDTNEIIKYRAIKQAQPEPVDPHATLRAEYIRQRDAVPCELGFYKWEYKGATEIDHPLVWTDGIDESVFKCFTLIVRCTDISCYVALKGEPAKRMLRTEAQELQRKFGDTVEWLLPDCAMVIKTNSSFEFNCEGTYTYAPKALKQVSWSDMPVGVMTNKGELRGVYLAGDNTCRICTESKHREDDRNWSRFIFIASGVELAPASEQPWIALQDGEDFHDTARKFLAAGLSYTFHANRYKITGIAKGYVLEGAV